MGLYKSNSNAKIQEIIFIRMVLTGPNGPIRTSIFINKGDLN